MGHAKAWATGRQRGRRRFDPLDQREIEEGRMDRRGEEGVRADGVVIVKL